MRVGVRTFIHPLVEERSRYDPNVAPTRFPAPPEVSQYAGGGLDRIRESISTVFPIPISSARIPPRCRARPESASVVCVVATRRWAARCDSVTWPRDVHGTDVGRDLGGEGRGREGEGKKGERGEKGSKRRTGEQVFNGGDVRGVS